VIGWGAAHGAPLSERAFLGPDPIFVSLLVYRGLQRIALEFERSDGRIIQRELGMNINWGTLSLTTAINLVLGAIILGFWKPWAAGYSAEKSKNFARKEDLDVIVTEVRAVEKARKETENTIWAQQTQWNHRRDAYAKLLTTVTTLIRASSDSGSVIEFNNGTDPNAPNKAIVEEELHKKLVAYREAQAAFLDALSVVQLLGSKRCNDELLCVLRTNTIEAGHVNWAREEVNIYSAARNALLYQARIDLGTDGTVAT
jgi:hypothetical protein